MRGMHPEDGRERADAMGVGLEGRVIGVQLLLVLVAAVVLLALGRDAVAAIVGGACITGPNAWLALRSRRSVPEGQELAGAAGMFLALFVKLALTILALALALKAGFGADGPAFFTGLIVALLGHHSVMLLAAATDEVAGGDGAAAIEDDRRGFRKDRKE